MMTTTEEALAALNAKKSAERQLAVASVCPPWRHAMFGFMMGSLVTTPAFPLPVRFVVLALFFVALVLIVRSDRKRMGVFINGYRRGRTRVVAFAMLAIILCLYALSVHRALALGDRITPVLLGVLAAVIGTIGSVIWQRVFVRELGA